MSRSWPCWGPAAVLEPGEDIAVEVSAESMKVHMSSVARKARPASKKGSPGAMVTPAGEVMDTNTPALATTVSPIQTT